jgi:hypothetical protein
MICCPPMRARTTTATEMLGEPGPFRAEHIRAGSRYELSDGHPILCMPTGQRGGRSNLLGGGVLETDPDVAAAGVDVGFTPQANRLRAPDVSVGGIADEPGWATGAPPLAVEYADTGQDEAELEKKIVELFSGGTKYVWVVRLTGPRRVEVHQKGKKMRLARPGEDLTAPGILKNPVPVLALFDREAAHRATFRNLLQRQGYESLDDVRAEGETKGAAGGRRAALLSVLQARGLAVSPAAQERIEGTSDVATLDAWIVRAATAMSLDAVLAEGGPPRRQRAKASR